MARIKVLCTAVHDGDSIKLIIDNVPTWVRLYAVDTAEVISNYVTASQPFGVIAADFLRSLIKGKTVEVEILGIDVYGRPLAQVWLDGKDVAIALLEKGLAWHIPLKKGEKNLVQSGTRKNYFDYFSTAKRTKKGIWSTGEKPVTPATWRSQHRRNIPSISAAINNTVAEFGFDFGDDYPQ